jgi:hypothetical protein
MAAAPSSGLTRIEDVQSNWPKIHTHAVAWHFLWWFYAVDNTSDRVELFNEPTWINPRHIVAWWNSTPPARNSSIANGWVIFASTRRSVSTSTGSKSAVRRLSAHLPEFPTAYERSWIERLRWGRQLFGGSVLLVITQHESSQKRDRKAVLDTKHSHESTVSHCLAHQSTAEPGQYQGAFKKYWFVALLLAVTVIQRVRDLHL